MAENKLSQQLSPYLKQHCSNPVEWHPWGDEAIRKAQKEKKMIFLSIGMSSCHWCHVMERESFKNAGVAKVMNDNYVNIKVDREERPDVDKMYMGFVQATTGSGGWPLSVWLAPDLTPIFGGTYFPPTGSFGQPGFTQVLEALANQWRDDQEEMIEAGEHVIKVLDKKYEVKDKPIAISVAEVSQKAFAQLSSRYEPNLGGFARAPKFPEPRNLLLLLRLQHMSEAHPDRRKRSLQMTLHTLAMMAKGGIHDLIGGGFANYSTDERWHVPHFEKMLYNQAQLAMAYTDAAKITGNKVYVDVATDILEYVMRDLTHPTGGFYSAENADSFPKYDDQNKKEGAFYVWEMDEVRDLLDIPVEDTSRTLADIVIHHYNMKDGGNVNPNKDPHGELKRKNVLIEHPVKDKIIEEEKYDQALIKARKIMFEERLKRPRPGLDDKLIASWNGMMISAFAKAGAAFNREDFTKAAIKAAHLVKTHMFNKESGTLCRTLYGTRESPEQLDIPIQGFLYDYAFVIQGMLDVYSATLDTSWLEFAYHLQVKQDDLFLDKQGGGYFITQEGKEDIVLRMKDFEDGAEPSGNSTAAMNLVRLGSLLDLDEFRREAAKIFSAFSEYVQKYPMAVPAMVEALMLHSSNPPLVVFTGKASSNALLKECHSQYLPSTIYAGAAGDNQNILYQRLKVLSQGGIKDGSLAYVVKNGSVSDGVDTFDQLRKLL